MDMLLLKLGDTIQGEVSLEGYQGWIEILSFSHGISQEVLHGLIGRSGTVGPKHQDFTLSKYLDLASVPILSACDHGTIIAEAIFTAGHAEADKFFPCWTVTMKNVITTSVSTGGGGGGKPTETVTLNYTAIRWLYAGRTPSNQPVLESTSWNLATNKEDS